MKNSILLVYNNVPKEERTGIYGECATEVTISQLQNALLEGGNHVYLLNARSEQQVIHEISEISKHQSIDLAFVIAEGLLDDPDTLCDGTGSQKIREVIQSLGIPTSHTDIKGMEICRHKDYTYKVLHKRGILVPKFFTIQNDSEIESLLANLDIEFPLFIKPAGGGNSVGISNDSIVKDVHQLIRQAKSLFDELGDITLIAETYLSGQEFTIGILGGTHKTVLPIIAFPTHYTVRSRDSKAKEFMDRDQFQLLTSDSPHYWQLYDIASATFDAVEGRDVIRIEVREDEHKKLYVIDVNGTPSLSWNASLTFMAENLGISFSELINIILLNSLTANQVRANPITEEFTYPALLKLRSYSRIVDRAI